MVPRIIADQISLERGEDKQSTIFFARRNALVLCVVLVYANSEFVKKAVYKRKGWYVQKVPAYTSRISKIKLVDSHSPYLTYYANVNKIKRFRSTTRVARYELGECTRADVASKLGRIENGATLEIIRGYEPFFKKCEHANRPQRAGGQTV